MGKKNLSSFSALLLVVPGLAGAWAEGCHDEAGPHFRSNPLRHAAEDGAVSQKNVETAYGKLPLSFELNRGQTDAKVKFLSRGRGYTLFLTPNEAVLALRNSQGGEDAAAAGPQDEKTPNPKPQNPVTVLRMRLLGANSAPQVEGRHCRGRATTSSGAIRRNGVRMSLTTPASDTGRFTPALTSFTMATSDNWNTTS